MRYLFAISCGAILTWIPILLLDGVGIKEPYSVVWSIFATGSICGAFWMISLEALRREVPQRAPTSKEVP